MPAKNNTTFQKSLNRFSFLMIMCFALSACGSRATDTNLQPILIATITPGALNTQVPSSEPVDQISATATPTLLPVTQANSSVANAGLIIFSMADGKYKHLFAYHPSYLPVTRLTSDAWDDDSPSVSPDGNKIAFISNRLGTREIFILDLVSNTLTQMTTNGSNQNSVSWSPDGQYIVYDTYQEDHYALVIQSVSNQTETPIQLSDEAYNNFQPSWSPDGTEIAFVTDRSGRNEIWLARLQDPDERFIKVLGSSDSDYSHPVWSANGSILAVSRHQTSDDILLIDAHNPESSAIVLGNGSNPVWTPDGTGILATLVLPNQTEIIAYSVNDHHLMLPPIPMAASLSSYDWKAANLSQNIQTYLQRNSISQPDVLWSDEVYASVGENGRRSLVPLTDVDAPQAVLSDAVDDSFVQLREAVQHKTGWDFLSTLENAAIASTATSVPDIPENWHYTGRAISLNLAPYEAEWMVVSREEFAGETYWRVWIKCRIQDGTCGEPLEIPIWDFNSRYSGEPLAYENGGEVFAAPSGYWVDFTELALRYGWERLPSLNNWKSYYPGIQFNTYVLRQGLSWQEALLDIYPVDQVELIIEKSQ